MDLQIAHMTERDYDEVLALWQATEGVGLGDADHRDTIARFLERNAGMSFVARSGGQVVGAVLGGENGRRGTMLHLAVAEKCRGRGIGRRLVECVLAAQREAGLRRCNIMVFADNADGREFWKRLGFVERPDVLWMTRDLTD